MNRPLGGSASESVRASGAAIAAIDASPNAVEVRGLTKRFGKNIACDAVDLMIPRGSTFGLLGPNGAGKSTFIRMLMGLIPNDDGQMQILGVDADQRSVALRRRIGYVPELHYIYRWMTVREVIGFVRKLYPTWDDRLTETLLEKFELPPSKRVSSLSKGMTAKLGLILALAFHPDLLILDEPTSGLDPIIREDFIESVLRSQGHGERTVLFSSHHVDDVERVSDEIGIIVHGRMVLRGSPDGLRSRVKRLRCVLRDGKLPKFIPSCRIHEKIDRREWILTVDDFSEGLVEQVLSENDLAHVDVIELNLEEIFKDVVRGRGRSNAMEVA
jgi:ABC-2 type transport system ATP-binding protein